MPHKIFEVAGIGELKISKTRRAKYIRLSISSSGQPRVSLPHYVPYSVGLTFAKGRIEWIAQHSKAAGHQYQFKDGARIGKSFRLRLHEADCLGTVKLIDHEIQVLGDVTKLSDKLIKVCEKALKIDADKLLLIRLDELSRKTGLKYRQAKVRKLTSRWGSCSSQQDITLSYYLIQLPWSLIDYVILHELNHTVHMNHGADFWSAMERLEPDAKTKRKILRQYKSFVTPEKLD